MFSGLRCNLDKSAIMYVGDMGPPPDYLREFDFQVVDQIKLLGLNIDKKLENLNECHTDTILKMTRIVNFWDRFFLSLPGRISIAKTFLLSQLSYTGCIISPTPAKMKSIKTLIERFIVGRLNIAKDRIYRPTSLGGLGMIDPEVFVMAQQVIWVKRANMSLRDNWRVDLQKLGHGNALTIGKGNFTIDRYLIFADIVSSYEIFLKIFNTTNNNCEKALILNNPAIKRGRNDNRLINENFFSTNLPPINMADVNQLKLNQLVTNGRLLSLDVITANTGIDFSLATYLRLQEACHVSRTPLTPGRDSDGSAISLDNFFMRFKKGSKQIRKIMMAEKLRGVKVMELTNVKTFLSLSALVEIGEETIKNCLSLWSYNFIPMNIREFSFKYFNNTLSLNNRLAHFVNGRAQDCTFCRMRNVQPGPDETFGHFFFDCSTTTRIRTIFENTLLSELNFRNIMEKKKFWLMGIIPRGNDNSNIFLFLVSQIFQFSMWSFKMQKRIPTIHSFEMEFFTNLTKIVKASRTVREHMALNNVAICRNWDVLQHRRG